MAKRQENDRRDRDEDDQVAPADESGGGLPLIPLALGILGLLVLLQAGALGYLFFSEARDPRVTGLENRLDRLDAEMASITKLTDAMEAYNRRAEVLEERLEGTLKRTDLSNYETIRRLSMEQEASFQRFIEALQQGMYDLSRMVRGSRTWYEVYHEALQGVLEKSRTRLETLRQKVPADQSG